MGWTIPLDDFVLGPFVRVVLPHVMTAVSPVTTLIVSGETVSHLSHDGHRNDRPVLSDPVVPDLHNSKLELNSDDYIVSGVK